MDLGELVNQVKHSFGYQIDFSHVVLGFALLMARILPAIILTPFLGGETVPNEVKLGLGGTLGLVLFPAIAQQVERVPISAVLFVALMLKELFLGLTLSFVVDIVFKAAQISGNLIDTMAGTNQAQLNMPQIQQQVSLFSDLQLQLVTVVFLSLDGHHLVIQAFGDSLEMIPLDRYPTFARAGTWALFDTVLRVSGDLLRIAVAIASPVLLATFITDLALGFVNRTASQVQVSFIAQQIKPVVTVLIMFTSLHLILDRVVTEYGTMFRWVRQVLSLLQ